MHFAGPRRASKSDDFLSDREEIGPDPMDIHRMFELMMAQQTTMLQRLQHLEGNGEEEEDSDEELIPISEAESAPSIIGKGQKPSRIAIRGVKHSTKR